MLTPMLVLFSWARHWNGCLCGIPAESHPARSACDTPHSCPQDGVEQDPKRQAKTIINVDIKAKAGIASGVMRLTQQRLPLYKNYMDERKIHVLGFHGQRVRLTDLGAKRNLWQILRRIF